MTDPASGGPATSDDVRDPSERGAAAAEPAAQSAEGTDALQPGARGALYALLSSLADNKYLLGRRYAEWCTGAPMLESAVAAAAMAQDELGHARSFYPLLRGFPEASEADTKEEHGWQERPTSAMACLDRPFEAWTDFVAANFLVDTALTTLLETATDSGYEPLRQRASKIVQEEAAHWVHATGWLGRLAASNQSRGMLVGSLQVMWDDALTWFGPTDDDVLGALAAVGLLRSGPDALRERLRNRLRPLLEDTKLVDELDERSLPWDRWDPRSRRLEAGSGSVACPFCSSNNTIGISPFGSQLLMSQRRCADCGSYFEAVRDDR
jgi:ring-1,2-phenylacetyl-CoA epoxidase subunit PaaC